ncbi:MAG: GIY-YIG nuclease family protein [Prolixibacteraceae bacterium]|nr:GIY-YIG nuclease family protein [Prolixibacteraceae bacterium]
MFYTYVIYSEKYDKIYIGFTSDIDRRLLAHNHPKNKGWTRCFMPWKLVHLETFENKTKAMRREKQLKSAKGREFIHNIISKS